MAADLWRRTSSGFPYHPVQFQNAGFKQKQAEMSDLLDLIQTHPGLESQHSGVLIAAAAVIYIWIW